MEYDGFTADPMLVYGYPDYIWKDDVLHVVYKRKHAELYYQRLSKDWLLRRE